MTVRVGINGLGRIGRQTLKAVIARHPDEIQVVGVNDVHDNATNAYLVKYDSNYGKFNGTVESHEGGFVINGLDVHSSAERDPSLIPWEKWGVDIVMECTGAFTDANKARKHIDAGAKKVIISAPGKNEDLTVVLGVNEQMYDNSKHHIISNASCTTNGLAPVAKVLFDKWGIEKGLLTAIHAYTNSQRLLDVAEDDIRDSRAAALNIVPSTTGAAKAVGLVIPELQGRFGGMSFRVPVPTGSAIDFTAVLGQDVTKEEVNAAMKEYAEGKMKGIMEYSEEPLVSRDIVGNSHSTIFSAIDTTVIMGNFVKVISWYDNEWGYACRLADITAYVAARL